MSGKPDTVTAPLPSAGDRRGSAESAGGPRDGAAEVPRSQERRRLSGPGDGSVIRVLEADSALADALDPRAAAVARRWALARVDRVGTGAWDPGERYGEDPGLLGLLVLEGLLTRDVVLGERCCTELLGQGDILRPWDRAEDPYGSVPSDANFWVLEPTRVAVLGRRFTTVIGRFPELTTAVASRILRRARGLALQLAVAHQRRVDVRVLTLLWHYADRWGKVGPDGVVLPLHLTHATLGKLSGARRPSVTTALAELGRRGRVLRRSDGSWLLRGEPPNGSGKLHPPKEAGSGTAPRPAMRPAA